MFEPPLINQLLGTGAVILGFILAGILARQMELHELEKQRKLEEREELDPSEYIYVGCGQYRYVGDEV